LQSSSGVVDVDEREVQPLGIVVVVGDAVVISLQAHL
jgi:hypothetical protein